MTRSKNFIFASLILIGGLCLSSVSYSSQPTTRGNSNASDPNAKGEKLYFLYGDAKAGTKFKERIATSPIPFDKSYKELSPDLKELVKASYGGLKESETPPFPADGNESLYRALIKSHRGIGREGDLLVVAMIKKMARSAI